MFNYSHNAQKYVELFNPASNDVLKAWKVLSSAQKVFDKELKSFAYCLKGKAPTPLMQWPKDKTNIVLTHPILVFQLYLTTESNILFDIRISTHNNFKKRISLSTNQKIVRTTSLSVILPVTVTQRGTWSHLLVDVEDVVSSVWKRDSFHSIDGVSLSGNCSIKRIFTLRRDMVQNEKGYQTIKYDQIPKQMLMSRSSVPTYDFIICLNDSEMEEDEKSPSSSFTNQLFSTPSSSKSSLKGHGNFRKGTCEKQSVEKSAKRTGSIAQSVSNKCSYAEDTRSKYSTEKEQSKVESEHVLSLLSRLTFTDAITEHASEL